MQGVCVVCSGPLTSSSSTASVLGSGLGSAEVAALVLGPFDPHRQGISREQNSRSPHLLLPTFGGFPSFCYFYLCPSKAPRLSSTLATQHHPLGERGLSQDEQQRGQSSQLLPSAKTSKQILALEWGSRK